MPDIKTAMPPKRAGSSDIFQTPKSAIDVILPFIPKHWTIWESACGEGQIVANLREAGYSVIGTDIMHGFDFLSPLGGAAHKFDCILTNPPYSLKDDWLERCYDIGKPFALLLPITALGEQNRVSLYRKHGIQLVLPPGRTNYGTPSGEGSGAWFYSAWFCHGLDLPAQITIPGAVEPEAIKPRLVILESPYAGDIEANVTYARSCLRDSLLRGEAPIASHLLYTQPGVLNDGVSAERQQGIDAGLAWRRVADASVVYTDKGVSRGMQYGIDAANAAGLPIEIRRLAS